MSIGQKTAFGLFWSGVQNWGSQAGSLLTFLVLARLLSPTDFGLVALANTFVAFFNNFIGQGFSQALVQRQEIENDHLNSVFWAQICLGISLMLIGFISARIVANIFQEPLLTPILRSFSVIFFLRSLNVVQRAVLRRKLAFQKIALRALLGIALGGITGIVLALLNWGVWSLVFQQLAFEITSVIVFWYSSDWTPKMRFSPRHFSDLYYFGSLIFFSNFLTFLNENSDTLLIGYFLGDFCLGYYAIAYRVFQVLTQLLVKTITQVTFPALSRLQNESQRLLSAFYQIVQHANLATIPVFLMVVLLSQELVLVVFGEQWLPSSSAMQVLTCSGIVYSVMTFNKSLLIATGQPLWQLKLEALNVVFNIASCLFAVRWGILAVAYAYAVSDLLVVPISLWVLKLTVCLSLEEYLKRFLSPFSCAVAMVITIGVTKYYLSVELSSYLVLISCTLIGVVSYVSCLLCLDPGLFKTALKVIKLR